MTTLYKQYQIGKEVQYKIIIYYSHSHNYCDNVWQYLQSWTCWVGAAVVCWTGVMSPGDASSIYTWMRYQFSHGQGSRGAHLRSFFFLHIFVGLVTLWTAGAGLLRLALVLFFNWQETLDFQMVRIDNLYNFRLFYVFYMYCAFFKFSWLFVQFVCKSQNKLTYLQIFGSITLNSFCW